MCIGCCNSDKDNNSAVISLGEMFSDNAQQQHLSSAGSPPPPPAAVSIATANDVPVPRGSVNQCASPPAGRSVSFQCGQIHRSDVDCGRVLGRRQSASASGDSKDVHVPMPAAPVLCHEPRMEHELQSLHCEGVSTATAAVCPSGSHVCKCPTALPESKLADVDGCRPSTTNADAAHKSQLTSKANVDEANPSPTATADCCVIHV